MTLTNTDLQGDLAKVQRDLSNANQALAAYWSRGISNHDFMIDDIHKAVEALMRATSTLTQAFERKLEADQQARIPCTDYACTREHITRRSGPGFASYHVGGYGQ